ncbi:BrnT family toxin [Beijerinckia sp. L45]|uniref:BrnT family toxin n=1 Tax=Beijerinckia sp. L45 TaxID=1641855 RepID=UPI00131EB90D|nr:BrnT family toxin [Beijerinckia sp. L45]
MNYSWDEAKRGKIKDDRGLDFADARLFFDGRPASHEPTPRNDEDRWKTTTLIEDQFYTVVWMWRDAKQHIISMRRAHEKEIRKYRELYVS